jgi:predicted DNA-binding transcriptional regulator YafY
VRADRLVAIVLLLQTHGQLTAPALADRLETSVRTIRRDLDSLAVAGVPVYAQRGRGGGWALLGGHRIDLSGLTVDEAQALFLVTGPGAAAAVGGGGSALGAGLDAALRKVLAALPEPLRLQVDAARSAVLVDPARWGGQPGADGRADDSPHLDSLRRAVVRRRQVVVRYAPPGRAPAERVLHPHGLVAKRGVWYLLATSDRGLRTYRVSRVEAVTVTDEPAVRPEAWDLAAEWARMQAEMPVRLASMAVDVVVDGDAWERFEATVTTWCRVERPSTGEGAGGPRSGFGGESGARVAATVWFPHPAAATATIAPFGGRVTVRAPAAVRDGLGALGRELAARYPDGD